MDSRLSMNGDQLRQEISSGVEFVSDPGLHYCAAAITGEVDTTTTPKLGLVGRWKCLGFWGH